MEGERLKRIKEEECFEERHEFCEANIKMEEPLKLEGIFFEEEVEIFSLTKSETPIKVDEEIEKFIENQTNKFNDLGSSKLSSNFSEGQLQCLKCNQSYQNWTMFSEHLVKNHVKVEKIQIMVENLKENILFESSDSGDAVGERDGEKGGEKERKTFCIYCSEMVSRLGRHLERKHKTEPQVLSFLGLPKKGVQRRQAVGEIKKLGLRQLAKTKNKFILQRRPNKTVKKDKIFLPCPLCKGLYSKGTLYRHYKRCSGTTKVPRSLIRESMVLIKSEESYPISICHMLKNFVFPGMHQDEVFNIIKKDKEILEFGNDLCLRYACEKHRKNHIRSQMRTLAILVLEARKIDENIKNLRDLIYVRKWMTFIESVQNVAGYDPDSGSFKAPYTVIHLGLMMTHIANNMKVECRRDEGGLVRRNEIQNWIDYFKHKYNDTIGRHALKVATHKKLQKRTTEYSGS